MYLPGTGITTYHAPSVLWTMATALQAGLCGYPCCGALAQKHSKAICVRLDFPGVTLCGSTTTSSLDYTCWSAAFKSKAICQFGEMSIGRPAFCGVFVAPNLLLSRRPVRAGKSVSSIERVRPQSGSSKDAPKVRSLTLTRTLRVPSIRLSPSLLPSFIPCALLGLPVSR